MVTLAFITHLANHNGSLLSVVVLLILQLLHEASSPANLSPVHSLRPRVQHMLLCLFCSSAPRNPSNFLAQQSLIQFPDDSKSQMGF